MSALSEGTALGAGGRKLGTAVPDLFKGVAALAIILALIIGAERFTVMSRILFGTVFFLVYVLWYFERYTFYEHHITVLRPSRYFFRRMLVRADQIRGIRFHKHLDLATGTLVYVSFSRASKSDLIAFNFREKHRFLLEFAELNRITVDTGGSQWIDRILRDIRENGGKRDLSLS